MGKNSAKINQKQIDVTHSNERVYTSKNASKNASKYAILFMVIFILSLVMQGAGLTKKPQFIQLLMLGSLFVLGLVLTFYWRKKKLDDKKILEGVILAGLIMRIGYMLYTPITLRQHDIGSIDTIATGHLNYIFEILAGHLPDVNLGQFYHPPLYHYLSALMIRWKRVLKPLK